MCQCLCCDCWWINYCGVPCGGIYHAYLCCSFWLCMPHQMQRIDPDCCKVACCVGYGYNHCCFGSVCCVTDSVAAFSKTVSLGSDAMVIQNNNNMNQPFKQGYWSFIHLSYLLAFIMVFCENCTKYEAFGFKIHLRPFHQIWKIPTNSKTTQFIRKLIQFPTFQFFISIH